MTNATNATNAYLAKQFPSPEGCYSDMKVMKSAAGYYIGTTFEHLYGDLAGLIEPGSRESEYFGTEEEAQSALDSGTWTQRHNP